MVAVAHPMGDLCSDRRVGVPKPISNIGDAPSLVEEHRAVGVSEGVKTHTERQQDHQVAAGRTRPDNALRLGLAGRANRVRLGRIAPDLPAAGGRCGFVQTVIGTAASELSGSEVPGPAEHAGDTASRPAESSLYVGEAPRLIRRGGELIEELTHEVAASFVEPSALGRVVDRALRLGFGSDGASAYSGHARRVRLPESAPAADGFDC